MALWSRGRGRTRPALTTVLDRQGRQWQAHWGGAGGHSRRANRGEL